MDDLRHYGVNDVAGDDESLQLLVARPEEEARLLQGERPHLRAVVAQRVGQEAEEVAQLGGLRGQAAGGPGWINPCKL